MPQQQNLGKQTLENVLLISSRGSRLTHDGHEHADGEEHGDGSGLVHLVELLGGDDTS